MTVLGPVSPNQLGITLPHEHVFADLLREVRVDGLLDDPWLAEQELREFSNAGGMTIVDCTSIGLGRDVEAVQRIARATELNIVVGTGFYRHPYLNRDWFDEHDANAIADLITQEITDGIGATGIRPGIIGEVGCDRYVSAAEERSFRAAARAHHRTGLTITTHAARWPVGGAQLDILEEERVDPHRVIIGHCDRVMDEGYHVTMARRGAFVQFDGIRPVSAYDVERTIRFILKVVSAGFIDQLLLSHDVCMRRHLRAYGGGGYSYLLTETMPRLRREGLSDDEVTTLLVRNPRRALTGELS
jgi:phosphotriesterase-related protein